MPSIRGQPSMAGVRGRGARGQRCERRHDRDRLAHGVSVGALRMVLAPTCSSSQAFSGSAARHVEATCSSAVVAADARRARQRAARDQRLVAQQLDARVVARVAARRGAQALADDLEAAGPRGGDELGELRAGCGRRRRRRGSARAGRAPAGDSPCPRRGPARTAARRGRPPGPGTLCSRPYVLRLVGRRPVGREAQVALLAKDLDLAAERRAELVEHGLQAAADVGLVVLARRGEVGLGVVALEPGEPLEHRRARSRGRRRP